LRSLYKTGLSAASELGDSNSLRLLAGRLHENFRDRGRLTGELQRGPLVNVQNTVLINPDYTGAIALHHQRGGALPALPCKIRQSRQHKAPPGPDSNCAKMRCGIGEVELGGIRLLTRAQALGFVRKRPNLWLPSNATTPANSCAHAARPSADH
jgi:hypothetical protein